MAKDRHKLLGPWVGPDPDPVGAEGLFPQALIRALLRRASPGLPLRSSFLVLVHGHPKNWGQHHMVQGGCRTGRDPGEGRGRMGGCCGAAEGMNMDRWT